MSERLSVPQASERINETEEQQPDAAFSNSFLEFLVGHPELSELSDAVTETTIPFAEPISTSYTYGEPEKNPSLDRAELTQLWSTDIYNGGREIKDGTKQD